MAKAHALPELVPPLPRAVEHRRNVPLTAPFGWLSLGWRDLWRRPGPSLVYGLAVAALSMLVVVAMFQFGWDNVLFPALAGFLVVGPVLAIGTYEKSRRLEAGEAVRFRHMLFPAAGVQHLFFVGTILMMIAVLWLRAAVLLYAIFFGWLAFPGFDQLLPMLVGTPRGIALLIVGTLVGGLFAALAFAVSVLSIPLVLDKQKDAFTAMGTSASYVWNNLPAMLVWGALVIGLTLVGVATGFVGFIILFPLLGHATWHAYRAMIG